MRASLIVVMALWAAGASAAVGKIGAVEGTATRTPNGGTAAPVVADQELELGDTLEVDATGSLQLLLSDESILMLGPGAKLQIDEAEFGSLENRRFSARLLAGDLWAHVKRALVGSEAKFEVVTERAVAGVRGTIFEVSVSKTGESSTDVGVEEGEVEVLQFNEGVAADAPLEKRFKRHRIKRGEALLVKKKLAQKRKHLRRANAFRRFVEQHRRQRALRQQERLERHKFAH